MVRSKELTEIGDARALGLDLVGNMEDGTDGGERRRHHLVVEHLHREGGGGRASRWPPHQRICSRFLARHCWPTTTTSTAGFYFLSLRIYMLANKMLV